MIGEFEYKPRKVMAMQFSKDNLREFEGFVPPSCRSFYGNTLRVLSSDGPEPIYDGDWVVYDLNDGTYELFTNGQFHMNFTRKARDA